MAAKAGLTTEKVVLEAAALANEVGWPALSLAALAQRLGVKTPSLYNHVDGLDALRRLLSIHACQQLRGAIAMATVGKSRQDAVLAMAQAHRAFIKAHPGLAEGTVTAPTKGDREHTQAADSVVTVCVSVLDGFALGRSQTLHVLRGLRSAVHGFATLEQRGGFGLPLDVQQSFEWMVQALVGALPAGTALAGQPLEAAAASSSATRFSKRRSVVT